MRNINSVSYTVTIFDKNYDTVDYLQDINLTKMLVFLHKAKIKYPGYKVTIETISRKKRVSLVYATFNDSW